MSKQTSAKETNKRHDSKQYTGGRPLLFCASEGTRSVVEARVGGGVAVHGGREG